MSSSLSDTLREPLALSACVRKQFPNDVQESLSMYLSLDEARDELRRRLLDQELRAVVRTELGAHFMEPFENSPVASADRHLLSPDNGIEFFHQGSRYIGATPLHTEFTGDLFVVINEEKKGSAGFG